MRCLPGEGEQASQVPRWRSRFYIDADLLRQRDDAHVAARLETNLVVDQLNGEVVLAFYLRIEPQLAAVVQQLFDRNVCGLELFDPMYRLL
jgi:hypothetical protein